MVLRLAFLCLVGALALWATHEASKGFRVTLVNALPKHSVAGQRFDLFYVSNDQATRILLNASDFVENLLYGGGERKRVSHVELRLGAGDFFSGEISVSVAGEEEEGKFVLDLSEKVMDSSHADVAFKSAILRGMARVWVWDNDKEVPREVLSGVVEYIVGAAGFGGGDQLEGSRVIPCGRDHRNWFVGADPRVVARSLARCEGIEKGFIRRLNGAMRDGWSDRTVEEALGKPAHMCLCGDNY